MTLELRQLELPIVQAGMGAVARHELAAAVSEAGGLGTIAGARAPIAKEIAAARRLTDRPIAGQSSAAVHAAGRRPGRRQPPMRSSPSGASRAGWPATYGSTSAVPWPKPKPLPRPEPMR